MTIVSRLAWDRGVGRRQSSPVNQSLAAPERTAFKAQTDLLAKVELVAVRQLSRRLDPNSVNEGSVGRADVDHATATDPPVHRGMSSADGELQDGHDPSAGSGSSAAACTSPSGCSVAGLTLLRRKTHRPRQFLMWGATTSSCRREWKLVRQTTYPDHGGKSSRSLLESRNQPLRNHGA
jgi:hypothetical protein